MDRCLKIPEIIRLICEGLGGGSDSAYSLSLVARRFVEPALDVRWRSVPSLMPIISCLPDDLWTVTIVKSETPSHQRRTRRVVVLRRAVASTDLKRYLDAYAPRIREIHSRDKGISVSSQVLHALQVATEFKVGALSPFLRAFYTLWLKPEVSRAEIGSEYSANIGSSVWLFIHPGVTKLNISTSSSDPIYLTAIRLTATRLPNVRNLTIGVDYDPFVGPYLASSSWEQLEKLTVHVDYADYLPFLTQSVIRQFSQLPALKSLTLCGLADVPPVESALNGNATSLGPWPYPFASLASLSLDASEPPDIIAFLGYLPARIRLTSLTCASSNESSDADIQTIVRTAHDLCDHELLQSFRLKINEYGEEEEEMVDIDEDGGLDIKPLLAFNNLKTLEIVINGEYRLTPSIAAQIPTSWPTMETMELRSTFQTTEAPSIDHRHLLALVRGLPLLRDLRIRFDATKVSRLESMAVAGSPLPLTVLRVADSPISSPSRVTSFLKANFSLREPPPVIRGWYTWKVPLYKTRWEAVEASW